MTNEPILETDECGNKQWLLNDELHRLDGPAIEWASGSKAWYIKGKLHREDGPAIEWVGGFKEWYLNGEFISYHELNKNKWRRLVLESRLKSI